MKVLLGLLTMFPVASSCIIMSFFVSHIAWRDLGTEGLGIALLILYCMITLQLLLLLPVYVMHLLRSSRETRARRIIWMFLFVAIAPLALPIYWYTRMLHSLDRSASEAKAHDTGAI
jgi:hypothetical protein